MVDEQRDAFSRDPLVVNLPPKRRTRRRTNKEECKRRGSKRAMDMELEKERDASTS